MNRHVPWIVPVLVFIIAVSSVPRTRIRRLGEEVRGWTRAQTRRPRRPILHFR